MDNKCCYISNQGDSAMKYLEKGICPTTDYQEAMNLLINLSNQPMEELDVIKRWRTLLQEDTENVMSDEIK